LKVVFLHLPKTAGQSVHLALTDAFGEDAVCPARVNDQLYQMSIPELNRYQVFSGHLDWSMLDCIKGPKYVFTVLREPIRRILSFYFYLRNEAGNLSQQDRLKPEHKGLKTAIELSLNEYFLGGDQNVRHFLDQYYDNLYAYYFAGRGFLARGQLLQSISRGALSRQDVVEMAKQNLSVLDDVFTLDDLPTLFSTIRTIGKKRMRADEDYCVNANTEVPAGTRLEQLLKLGADNKTLERIDEMCALDNQIWDFYQNRRTDTAPRVASDAERQSGLFKEIIGMFSR
jgi:hypothetical protein